MEKTDGFWCRAFITKKTGVHPKKAKVVPSSVEMLTDTTFKQQIGGDKDVIVAFTGLLNSI